MMLRRGAATASSSSISLSVLSDPAMLIDWCCTRRRPRRRRGGTIRLGNKRRGFTLGSRPVARWRCMVGPLRRLKKMLSEMVSHGRWIEAYYLAFPFVYSLTFPPLI
uniref:Uncharacterized protein n=1 Tax=Nelumbo nucifera TaxID=4432 RepID=A0A822XW56_NELNU|nr:TPA_asm: hypothetical protein HUJ06_025695 [Nelumbo nucifera]